MAAFDALWRRHIDAARATARALTPQGDAEDVVHDAYLRILDSLRRGRGPSTHFRPYLMATIRNRAADLARQRARHDPTQLEESSGTAPSTPAAETDAVEKFDRAVILRAFESLPERWQEVLWLTEVDGLTPRDAAPILGLSANAVSQLAFRARAGLRDAWVAHHVQSRPHSAECAWVLNHLGGFSRHTLASRDQARVRAHLADCEDCTAAAAEAQRVANLLPLALLPAVLGGLGAAAAYLQASAHVSAPVALAASGAAVVTPATSHTAAHLAGAASLSVTTKWLVATLVALLGVDITAALIWLYEVSDFLSGPFSVFS
ncbi:hypothetical protein GCM10009808_22630 [Microbacterium sediminicola]|uniref:Sigma-70 family RNA polymerase sigma factor n=2 Tax=Microbacterium sediminicola TaxID=415210 RepID=A0ABP4UEN7_9MICO